MWDVLPLPLKCDIMFMITCMFITTCMFIITSCPHLNCHFLMNKLSLPMAVDCVCFVNRINQSQFPVYSVLFRSILFMSIHVYSCVSVSIYIAKIVVIHPRKSPFFCLHGTVPWEQKSSNRRLAAEKSRRTSRWGSPKRFQGWDFMAGRYKIGGSEPYKMVNDG